jgi:hypothetical protein
MRNDDVRKMAVLTMWCINRIVEDDEMQCPYCKEKMRRGYLQSPRQKIFWAEEKHKMWIWPSGSDISLSEGLLTVPAVDAYCCQGCRKVIVDF